MKLRKYRVVLAYDGTAYSGWQYQENAIGVQQVVEEALAYLEGAPVRIFGSSRTDAGVHARGQVVNFFTDGRIPVDRIVRAVNSLLPKDIAVTAAGEADDMFSARHSAKSKTYIYRIQRGEVPDPLTARYAWYIRRPIISSRQSTGAWQVS